MNNNWDKVADIFDTYKEDVWRGAADNIDTVWPVILDYIKNNFPSTSGQKTLEFGCGTGMFCRELKNLGFNVTGVDISPEMIKIGQKNLDPEIKLFVGDAFTAKQAGLFDLITSIMVLQFLEETEIAELAKAIEKNGHLIFAIFSPEELDGRGVADTLTLTGTNVSIPIYKRTAKEYQDIFNKLNFTNTFEHYARASKEFLAKYNIVRSDDIPKYMILGYKKI